MAEIALFFERPVAAGPKLHALLIGVSSYPWIPGGALEDQGQEDYELKQLTGAARGAHELATWLIAHKDDLVAPLASVCLLASPSTDPAEAALPQVPSATLANVRQALREWRVRCGTSREDVAWFHFSGHGIGRNTSDAVFLLEDFNDPRLTVLGAGIELSNVFDGMAPSNRFPDISRNQLYVYDACRTDDPALQDYDGLQAGIAFDPVLNLKDDRRAPLFYASMGGATAYMHATAGSLFVAALLACLNGEAVDELPQFGIAPPFGVSASTLSAGLERELERLREKHGGDADYVPTGLFKDVLLARSPQPVLDVTLQLDRPEAAAAASLSVRLNGALLPLSRTPLQPHPLQEKLAFGIYEVSVVFPPGSAFHPKTKSWFVKPAQRFLELPVGVP